MDLDTLRNSLSAALHRCESPNLVRLGDAVATEACWGTLVEALERFCAEDSDYLALLDILVGLEDARALILFTSAVRAREAVLRGETTIEEALRVIRPEGGRHADL